MNDKIDVKEIEKWLVKLEPLADKIEVEDKGKEYFDNMKAYIADCKHFLTEKDLFRALEAVLWAHCIYEICTDLGLFKVRQEQ